MSEPLSTGTAWHSICAQPGVPREGQCQQFTIACPACQSHIPPPTLLSSGFWVLTPKTKQTVPLTIAAARGYTDCARHLIQQGAELDARVGGRTALHEACAQAQSDCVRLLLTFGAKANVLSEEGTTPLHLCTAPESLQ